MTTSHVTCIIGYLQGVFDVFLSQGVFTAVCAPKSKLDPYRDQQGQRDKAEKKKKRKTDVSGENFMPYRPKDYESEQG